VPSAFDAGLSPETGNVEWGEPLEDPLMAQLQSSLASTPVGRATGVSPMRVSHLIKGKRRVNGEQALRLGAVLGRSPQYWLNLQAACDLVQAKAAFGRKLDRLHVLPQLGPRNQT
jgi:antitoxin HigA-1